MPTEETKKVVDNFDKLTKQQLGEHTRQQDVVIRRLHDQVEGLIAQLTTKPQPKVGDYLQEALSISGVNSERGAIYGSALENFTRIANLITAQLGLTRDHTYGKLTSPISIEEVSLIMQLVKMARLQVAPNHRDSWVDIAGYVNCVGDMHVELGARRTHLTEEESNSCNMAMSNSYEGNLNG